MRLTDELSGHIATARSEEVVSGLHWPQACAPAAGTDLLEYQTVGFTLGLPWPLQVILQALLTTQLKGGKW
jgi:hypothetical protein